MKTEADIHFIKTCKRENIIPTFAKVKLSIKHGSKKLHSKIARLVMETELQAKHQTKKKIKREIHLIAIFIAFLLLLQFFNSYHSKM